MASEILSDSKPDMHLWEEKNNSLNGSGDYNDSYYYYDDDNYTAGSNDIFADMPGFMLWYDTFQYSAHGYVSLIVIIFGTIANIINMIVFTRKNMISAINDILTALAFADMMVLVTYLVKIQFHSTLNFMSHTESNYFLAVFCLFLRNTYVLAHALSVWLTVLVAIWRVMGVCYPVSTMGWSTRRRAWIAIISTYITCTFICIPEYLLYKVNTTNDLNSPVHYEVVLSDLYLTDKYIFDTIDTWVFEVLLKLFPCIPLTGLTLTLIWKIYKSKKKRRKLNVSSECDESRDRTTRILIVILLFFLFTKVPVGIIYILDFGLRIKFFHALYFILAGTVNVFILLNSAINFIVYCSLSSQFRDTMVEVALQSWKSLMDKMKKHSEVKRKQNTQCL